MEEDLPDLLADRAGPRLSRDQYIAAFSSQPVADSLDDRRLPAALRALECDEHVSDLTALPVSRCYGITVLRLMLRRFGVKLAGPVLAFGKPAILPWTSHGITPQHNNARNTAIP